MLLVQVAAGWHGGGLARAAIAPCLAHLQPLGFAFNGAGVWRFNLGLVSDQFDLLFVAQNTSFSTPLLYKVVGVWGNHEGSLILWLMVLAIFLMVLSRQPATMPERTHGLALLFLGLILLGFMAFRPCWRIRLQAMMRCRQARLDLNPCCKMWASPFIPRCSIWAIRLRR